MADEKERESEKPAWQASADAMRERAGELRRYAGSPVETDTSGRRDYWREFLDSRIARRQETDEQRERREKGERANRRIAALADGLVALSNVAGAMGGATPVAQTAASTMSAAHKKAVDEALKRRKELAAQYEVARKNAATLALKRDEANAKRHAAGVKSRWEAAKQADSLLSKAATLERLGSNAENAQANADRNYGLANERVRLSKQREARLAIGGAKPTYDTVRTTTEDKATGTKTVTTKHMPMEEKVLKRGVKTSPTGGARKKKSPTA